MDSAETTGIVFDDLLDSDAYEDRGKSFVIRKLKSFCETFSVNYESGNILASSLIGKVGKGAVGKNDKDYLEIKFYQPNQPTKATSCWSI